MDRFKLGTHSRKISTTSPEAQRWFDLGLNWCFGFNKNEGIRCFRRALEFDPSCVMAHWGIAYGSGPFYNLTWREHGAEEADAATRLGFEHIAAARAFSAKGSELENRLVEAMARRIQKPHSVPGEEFDRWDDDYAAELRRISTHYPEDRDVMALFVEALITRTPRRLWDVKTGLPARNSDVIEALQVCDRAIELADRQAIKPHPAIVHLQIHALEMSNEPERGMRAADTLATLCPDAGHLNHMPGHIYMLCGDYSKAKAASERAIVADDIYLDYAGPLTFYTVACAHDLHLMMYACMFMGRYQDSIDTANKMCRLLSRDVLGAKGRPKFTMSLEGYYSMKTHVMVRFGRWQEIIDEPLPGDPSLYLVSTAMHHYAKGIAHATLKQFELAASERELFQESLRRIPHERRFFNNEAHAILAVGEKMLDGELAYHQGNYDVAFTHLRESVRLDDNLEYIEPWAWMHPPRHALAALLMEQGQFDEAEEIYRDDLGLSRRIQRCAQHPDNVWALHGLVECLLRRGEKVELPALQTKLATALELADISITSSCMCRGQSLPPMSCCH